MAKYVCPNCHQNNSISEYVDEIRVYTGQFNDVMEIEDDQAEVESMYTDYYMCLDCQYIFNEPELVKEK